ncbi:beta-glucuronosyltransferase GlcAT14A, partial [Nicotiana tomentosiformis]|uniref:beta-glucuronosyltransferase GlcAT14A n=1 Tax=Nicotiana tomentosiformis TaxID=4098 RepID=UPI00388C5070
SPPYSLSSLYFLSPLPLPPPRPTPTLPFSLFHHNPTNPNDQNALLPTPPSIAYLISGSTKDSSRILRLLFSIYHPRNQYLIHLDKKTSKSELNNLALTVQSVPVFKAAQNINVIGKADFRYKIGSCSLAAKLHGASILLKLSKSWDWFINLSAADYPLVTQDDLLHILSYLPKDLNFVNHSSYIGWRESKKLKPIVVDPGLYLAEESEVYYATQKRVLPDAYRLFTGSSSAILTRKFIEYCILGSENLPRTLLMYLSNSPSSESVYFPTILCNSQKFNRTTINHNMLYASLNSRSQARQLNSSDFNDLLMSGAAFASPFKVDDPVLDQIDHELLHHNRDEPVPGGWCLGDTETNKCSVWGDAEILRPGPGAKRLEKHFLELFSNESYLSDQCQYEKSSSSR